MIVIINKIILVNFLLCSILYNTLICNQISSDFQIRLYKYSNSFERCKDCRVYGNISLIKRNLRNKVFCYNDQCQCPADYKYDTNTKSCRYFQCFKDSDCQMYDKNRVCQQMNTISLGKQCACKNGFMSDPTNNNISIMKRQHGQPCNVSTGCGTIGTCWKGVCKCPLNYDHHMITNTCRHNGCLGSRECKKCLYQRWCTKKIDGCYCFDGLYDPGIKCDKCSMVMIKTKFHIYFGYGFLGTLLIILIKLLFLTKCCGYNKEHTITVYVECPLENTIELSNRNIDESNEINTNAE